MSLHTRLTSRQSPVVGRFRRAATGRHDAGLVLLDGEHLVREALALGVPIDEVLSDEAHASLATAAGAAGAAVWMASSQVLDAASPVRTPSGIVALARWQPGPIEPILAHPDALVIGLCDVQDPGNVGAAIRSADALGATGLLAIDATADPGGWKALRGSMGSTFRLPVARVESGVAIDGARRLGLRVYATLPDGATDLAVADFSGPTLVLLGSEGAGLRPDLAARADGRLSITMRTGVDSLNVAVTTALIVDMARRQRAGRTDR